MHETHLTLSEEVQANLPCVELQSVRGGLEYCVLVWVCCKMPGSAWRRPSYTAMEHCMHVQDNRGDFSSMGWEKGFSEICSCWFPREITTRLTLRAQGSVCLFSY